MISPNALKNSFFTRLITLCLAVLITACSTDENFSADQGDTTPTTEVDTGINENSPAEISGVNNGSVTEDLNPDIDGLLKVSGKLTIVDSDIEESAFLAMTSTGGYGSLNINSTGNWQYTVENNLSIIQNLSTGSSLVDSFSISSVDGTSHLISITILGVNEANQPAIISGTDTGNVTEDTAVTSSNRLVTSGNLNITDNDDGENVFISETKNTNFGSFIIYGSGLWIYSANNDLVVIQGLENGQTLTDSIGVNSLDGTAHTIVITIIGIDEPTNPAIISGTDSGSVTEDIDPDNDGLLETSGTLNIFDADPGEASFQTAGIAGNYGNLFIDTSGNWSYSTNNSQSVIQNLESNDALIESLTIYSVDNTSHTILITINGADESNTPAIISGTDSGSVTEDIDPDNDGLLETSGTLNILDADAGEASFQTAGIAGNYGNLFIDTSGNWSYSTTNNQSVIQNLGNNNTLVESLTIYSADSTSHTISITINGADETITTSNITLGWAAPTEREDNTPLALPEIAGYIIYYGTTSGQYDNNVSINSSNTTSHLFEDFATDTYYFVMTTLDTDGRESQQSPEIQITN